MKRIGLKYCIYIVTFLFSEWLLEDVSIERYEMVLVFALLLLLLNMTLKPLLLLLSIPLNMITFGAFTLLINGWMVQIVDAMMPSVTIDGFFTGLFMGLIIVLLYFLVVPKSDPHMGKGKWRKASA